MEHLATRGRRTLRGKRRFQLQRVGGRIRGWRNLDRALEWESLETTEHDGVTHRQLDLSVITAEHRSRSREARRRPRTYNRLRAIIAQARCSTRLGTSAASK